MTRDRRKNMELTQGEVKKILNPKQLTALIECQYFGWKLKFVRRPLFQAPVPVLYNASIDQIGILDPDGHINFEMNLEVRSAKSEADPIERPLQAPKAPDSAFPNERRKLKATPVSENLEELLNQHQMRALHQIKTFGWQLHFVRRSLFQDPVAVIISPEGDRFATLEHDGRINMTPDTDLRKQARVEKTASFMAAFDIKRA